jgi:hypothetical protein
MRVACLLLVASCGTVTPLVDRDEDLPSAESGMEGAVHVRVYLTAQDRELAHATGFAELTCPRCSIEGQAIGEIHATVRFEHGRGAIEVHADNPGKVTIDATGTVELASTFDASEVTGRVMFWAAPDLAMTDPKLAALVQIIGPTVPVTGKLSGLRLHSIHSP